MNPITYAVLVCVTVVNCTWAIVFYWKETKWRDEAIEHGTAQYNQTTGEWEWKEKPCQ